MTPLVKVEFYSLWSRELANGDRTIKDNLLLIINYRDTRDGVDSHVGRNL